MKLITFAVPCYNSAAYMKNCIDKLLLAGQEAEIIIINDGSKDETGAIADKYAAHFPDIVRVIHQENGGHGEGVNQGLRHATGLYYKVVDSDDWLDPDAMKNTLKKIRSFVKEGKQVDLFIANYVYEHPEGPGHVMKYSNIFKKDMIYTWDSAKSFGVAQYLMMHSAIFRTEVLRECKVELPKHTFYVDNLFVYAPLPFCKSIYYLNEDLYRYFIGRDDQSVQECNLIKRVDQHHRVAMLMIGLFDMPQIYKQSKKLYKVVCHHMAIVITITAVFLYMDPTEQKLALCRDMWQTLKNRDKRTYRRIRYCSLAALTRLFPGKAGRKLTVFLYRIARKIFKFN